MKLKLLLITLLFVFSFCNVFPQITGAKHIADTMAVADFIKLSLLPTDTSIKYSMPEEIDENRIAPGIIPGSTIYYEDTSYRRLNQGQQHTPDSPVPASNFQGLLDDITSIPPDVGGAAGPNHLMVTHNSGVRILSKAGVSISSVSLDNFWSPLGTFSNVYDPKVNYDPYLQRWMVTSCGNGESTTSCLLVAVSQSNDPTGSWYFYKIDADATNTNWFDYPSFGFNKNWIIVTGNMFTVSANNFSYGKIWVLDKADFYSGGTGNFTAINSGSNGFTICPAVTFDSTINTEYLLQEWNGNSGGLGSIRLYTITGAIGSETLTAVSYATTSSTWSENQPGGADSGPQLGSTHKIDLGDTRMQNVVYRNGSVWGTHNIFLPASSSSRSAVQWWQLTTAGAVTQRSTIDYGSSTKFYAYPSIAVNAGNDVLIGYSSFSSSQYASSDYSFRYSCEPVNTMESDYLYKAGEAKYYKTYSGTKNRWGDFTSTCIDPVNDNDFWTLQEYATTPASGYDRWATWWAKVAPALDGGTGTWTWTGGSDTDWFNRCNWDKFCLPDSQSDVVVPGGTTYNPTVTGNTATCKTITINQTAGGNVTINYSGSGNLSVAQ